MKTILKPMMNIAECNITERNRRRFSPASSSTVEPEMSETYPGTSGNTHGDRNDSMPAINAARGKGRLDIMNIVPGLRDAAGGRFVTEKEAVSESGVRDPGSGGRYHFSAQ